MFPTIDTDYLRQIDRKVPSFSREINMHVCSIRVGSSIPSVKHHSETHIIENTVIKLTFTTLWAFSADDKEMIFFLIFLRKI